MADLPAIVLGTLKDVGDWAPIPLLSTVASLTLTIYDIAMTVQENKEAIKSLANDTAEASYIIITGLQHEGRKGVQYTSQIETDLRALLDDLQKIELFIKKYREKRKWYTKTFNYQADKGAIAGHRESLNHALTKFGLKSNIELRILVSKLVDEQTKFLESIAQVSEGKSRESRSKDIYGSMLPATFALSIQNGGSVTVNHIQGNSKVKHSSKKVTNVNSGNSYSVVYTGK
ncbi:hypothetical protein AX16_008255 [Volvariella volvacea WC 439]|nr:hypothetical protein AX16_008255 [Volvariella volvacea WC 439]